MLLGILLAFSIDAWWDLRTQNEEARAYVAAIRTELQANQEALGEELATISAWVSESEWYLNNVVSPDASPKYDQVREMVWKTGPDRTVPLARAAIDDLISSGGFQVIDSPRLRRSIADYIRALDEDADELQDVRDSFNQFIYPYHIQEGSFAEYDWEAYSELPESPVAFELNVQAFANNRVYANLLISRILEYSNLRDSHRNVLEKIEAVLALIDSTDE